MAATPPPSKPAAQSSISRLEITDAVLTDILSRVEERIANASDALVLPYWRQELEEGKRLLTWVKAVSALPSGDPERLRAVEESMSYQRRVNKVLTRRA